MRRRSVELFHGPPRIAQVLFRLAPGTALLCNHLADLVVRRGVLGRHRGRHGRENPFDTPRDPLIRTAVAGGVGLEVAPQSRPGSSAAPAVERKTVMAKITSRSTTGMRRHARRSIASPGFASLPIFPIHLQLPCRRVAVARERSCQMPEKEKGRKLSLRPSCLVHEPCGQTRIGIRT